MAVPCVCPPAVWSVHPRCESTHWDEHHEEGRSGAWVGTGQGPRRRAPGASGVGAWEGDVVGAIHNGSEAKGHNVGDGGILPGEREPEGGRRCQAPGGSRRGGPTHLMSLTVPFFTQRSSRPRPGVTTSAWARWMGGRTATGAGRPTLGVRAGVKRGAVTSLTKNKTNDVEPALAKASRGMKPVKLRSNLKHGATGWTTAGLILKPENATERCQQLVTGSRCGPWAGRRGPRPGGRGGTQLSGDRTAQEGQSTRARRPEWHPETVAASGGAAGRL